MKVWKLLFSAGEVLSTEVDRAPFELLEITEEGVLIRVIQGGRRVRLTWDRISSIRRRFAAASEAVDAGHGVLRTVQDCWAQDELTIDYQNESQYWAVVCEYRRRYRAVRAVVRALSRR